MKENRRTLRFDSGAELACHQRGTDFEIRLVDISWGGARIHSAHPLKLGSSVYLRSLDRRRGSFPIKAKVRWHCPEAKEFGLEFRDGRSQLSRRWIRQLFPQEGRAWTASLQQRNEVRVLTELPVVLAHSGSEGVTVDLSNSGACVTFSERHDEVLALHLCLPWSVLDIRANVMRVEANGDQWKHFLQFSALPKESASLLDSYMDTLATGIS